MKTSEDITAAKLAAVLASTIKKHGARTFLRAVSMAVDRAKAPFVASVGDNPAINLARLDYVTFNLHGNTPSSAHYPLGYRVQGAYSPNAAELERKSYRRARREVIAARKANGK